MSTPKTPTDMVKRNREDDYRLSLTLNPHDFEKLRTCTYHLFILAQTLPNVVSEVSDYTKDQQEVMIEKRLALQNIAASLKEILEKTGRF